MLSEIRKTIYIKDTMSTESYYDVQTLYGLANFRNEYIRLLRRHSEEEVNDVFDKIRQEDNNKYLLNYVYAPIKLLNSIIGYIYVSGTVLEKISISYEQAHQIDLLSQLYSYAASKTLIAQSYYRHSMTKIINISLAGLLFELNDDEFFDYITENDRLKMIVQVRHHILHFQGEISRYYPVENGYHIGVEFFNSAPDDFKHLENYFFERSLTEFR